MTARALKVIVTDPAKPKHAGGRPTLYDPRYCEEMVECCALGHSITGFAGKIGVDRDTITHWGQQHPEFFLAIKKAKAAATRELELDANRIRKSGGGPGAPAMTIFQMKNFAPDEYADRFETKNTDEVKITFKRIERVIVYAPDTDRSRLPPAIEASEV